MATTIVAAWVSLCACSTDPDPSESAGSTVSSETSTSSTSTSESSTGAETGTGTETGSNVVSCDDFEDQSSCESAVGAINEDIETDCAWLAIYEMTNDGQCLVSPTDRGLCRAVSGNDDGCEALSNACGVELLEVYAREVDGLVELVYDTDLSCRGPGIEWTDCLDDGMGGVQNELCACACDFVP